MVIVVEHGTYLEFVRGVVEENPYDLGIGRATKIETFGRFDVHYSVLARSQGEV